METLIEECGADLKLTDDYDRTAFLIACGADTSCVGEGRFRLCGKAASIQGCFSAFEWTNRLIAAEVRAGVSSEARKDLEECRTLLQFALEDDTRQRPRSCSSAEATAAARQLRQDARQRLRLRSGGAGRSAPGLLLDPCAHMSSLS